MSVEQSNFLTSTISESTYSPFAETEWASIKIGTYVRILLKNNSSTRGGRLVAIKNIPDSDKLEFSVKHHKCNVHSKVIIDDIQKIYQLKDDKKNGSKEDDKKNGSKEADKKNEESENKKEDSPTDPHPKNKKSSDVISIDNIKVIKYIMPRIDLLEDKVKDIESNIKKIIDILKSKQ
jgi:hypothetical protein